MSHKFVFRKINENTFAFFFSCDTFDFAIPLTLTISPIHNTLYRMSRCKRVRVCGHPIMQNYCRAIADEGIVLPHPVLAFLAHS